MWCLRNSEGYDQSHYAGNSLHDTKIIPDFAFVSSYGRTVILRLFLLRSETALRHRRSLKVDRHSFRRSVNRFSSKMSRGERGLGASDMKVYFQERGLGFSSPNWPLGQPAALVLCSMCVDDLFQFYTVVVHTTGYIFMSTRKSISIIVWTLGEGTPIWKWWGC